MYLPFSDNSIYIGTIGGRDMFLIKLEEEIESLSGMIIDYLPYYISTGQGTGLISEGTVVPFFGFSIGYQWGQYAGSGWMIKCCVAPLILELLTPSGLSYSNIFDDYYKGFRGIEYDEHRKVCSDNFLRNVITNPDDCTYDTMLQTPCEYKEEIKKDKKLIEDTKEYINHKLINNVIGVNNIFGANYKFIDTENILPESIASLVINNIKTKTNNDKLVTDLNFHEDMFDEFSILLKEKEEEYELANIVLEEMRTEFKSLPKGNIKKKGLLVNGKTQRIKTNQLLLEINHIKCDLITIMSYIKTYNRWMKKMNF